VKGQLGDEITATQRNMYMQRLPFDVLLKLTGQLLQPQVAFDIVLPENKSYSVAGNVLTDVRTKLDQLRLDEGEMNKQVFSLLVLTRFFAETPFDGTGVSANTMVRQSVSKLLTEQLNRMSEGLIKGVDLNFDLQSSEDYSTGTRADRTDLNIGLSKKMFDDRLTVSIGSNFELEGPQNSNQQAANIAGNIAVDYRLSKDGRYMLRAYRKNEFQGVIDGYIIETGLGFVITLDYNRFRDIFRKQKTPEQRQKEREERQAREAAEAKQKAN
jgi:translocation and assembly module TamB